jgi:hypothetical protein
MYFGIQVHFTTMVREVQARKTINKAFLHHILHILELIEYNSKRNIRNEQEEQ